MVDYEYIVRQIRSILDTHYLGLTNEVVEKKKVSQICTLLRECKIIDGARIEK